MKTATISILTAILFLLATSLANAETKEFPLSSITKVEVRNTSGKLNITAVENGQAIVVAEKRKFGDRCKLEIVMKRATLFVEVSEMGVFGDGCVVDLSISSPKNTALDLSSGSGNVKVSGTSGDLTYQVGSGDLSIDGEIKKMEGKIGSGNAIIKGPVGGGKVRSGSGNISLVYNVAPADGELDIKTGSGNAEIVFPKTAKIRTSFTSGSGQLRNELGESPNSKFKVSMLAGSGDLRIKKR